MSFNFRKTIIGVNMLTLLFGIVAVLIMLPLWFSGEGAIIGDENIMFQRYEAFYQTVVQYSQWPGLNPWNAGGQPLAGYPNVFIFSIKSILVLLFGTRLGIGISIVLYILIGYMGSRLLASIFWKNEVIKNIFALLVVFNLPLFFHLSAGHIVFYVYYLFPLMLYYFLRSSDDGWSGVKAGVIFGLAFLDTPVYVLQYFSVVMVLVYFWFVMKANFYGRKMLYRWLILFTLVVLTIISYQVIAIYQVSNEFPRLSNLIFHYSWLDVFRSYFYPFTEIEKVFITPPGVSGGSCSQSTHEISAYLGVIGFTLVIVSLKNGIKWWHSIILLLFIAGLGNDSVFSPMYWLQKLPSFSSHLCFSRVRMITHLFLPFAITGGLWVLWSKFHLKKYGKIIIIVIGISLILERLIIGFMIIKDTHISLESADPFYSTHLKYVNKDSHFINVDVIPPFEATKLNIGILRGGGDSHLPMNNIDLDGYSGPIGKNEEGYISEFHQNGQKIEPDYWSPNKIEFSRLDPKIPLVLNMNPSSAWHSNGIQLYPNYKIVEANKEFSAMPNKDGRILLSYEFPGRKLGLAVTMLFFVITIVIVAYFRRSDFKLQKNARIRSN